MIYGYKGNPKLRRAYINITLTNHEVDEYRKCAKDPIYFIKNYMKIVTPSKGLQPFNLYPFQEDMIKTFERERFVICKIPRQSGKSTTVVGYLLHAILFNENYSVAIVAHKGPAANGTLQRLRLAYENLPRWLQQGILEWNKGSIELENGSKIAAFATTADGLRSGSYDAILLDEFAFVQQNIAEDFFTSTYPVITAGDKTKIIIVSTPKGMNHFYEMWLKATKKKSNYFPIEVHWSAVPGRDEKWKEETIQNTSAEQFRQEFETEFLGSSNTLINGAKLKILMELAYDPIRVDNELKIYENPVINHTYTMTVDVAEGLGLDYSTFQVIDVTNIPYKVVATYRNNRISPYLFPTVIIQTAKMYNDAFVLVEINSIGLQVSDTIHFEFGYENLIKVEVKGKQGQTTSPGFKKKVAFGIKTSTQTKMIGCTNLKTMIEADKLIVPDMTTLAEFTTFVGDKKVFKAEEGKNDDLVMCLVHFGWLTGQRYFKENINNNIRQLIQKEQMNLMDDDVLPPPIIDDGIMSTLDVDIENEKYVDKWIEDRKSRYNYTKEQLLDDIKRKNPFDDHNLSWQSRF